MPFAIKAKLEGLDRALALLRELPKKLAKKTLRAGVNQATKLLLSEAKSRVPPSTGLLRKSLGRKVKVYKGAVVGIVGPRKGFKIQVGVRMRGPNKGTPVYMDPVRYAHLVENGTSHSAAKPFLRPAFEATKGLIVTAFENIVLNAIEDAAKGGGE